MLKDLPAAKIDMVLDSDTYNEVDDQFALCYALLSPQRLNVQATYAAPFLNARSSDAGDGMQKSYDEIVRLLNKMGRASDMVFKGATSFLPDEKTPVDSPAVRDLISRAMARPIGDPLYVVCIGAITNLASALLIEPRIAGHIAVVWLGGQPLSYPTALEFNLMQDIPAVRVVLNAGLDFTLIPCTGVASHLLTTPYELRAHLSGKNAMCDALIELFCAYSDDHFAWAKEIWDVSAIAYLINPAWIPTAFEPSPILSLEGNWSRDARRPLIRVATYVDRNAAFKDMFAKLAKG